MSITRRELLGGSLAAGALGWLGNQEAARGQSAPPTDGPAEFTFVHLTDMHVTPKRWGDKGYKACIESVRNLNPRPAFALMGGDLAFDGLYTPRADFEEQIRLYLEISKGLGMPVYHCMGNHDVLGWSSRRKVDVSDPELGKRMIMERLEWPRSWYSFDFAGWRFCVLDCIHPKTFDHGPGYEPRIGDEQLEWLAGELGAAGDRPKVCVTHIAAMCNLAQIDGNTERKAFDGSMVLWDTRRLREVLERHEVAALLQGHSHRIEEYRYDGVWYLTSPAVSAAWWSGDWLGFAPGYTVFSCGRKGLSWRHCVFEWEPHLEPEDDLERQKLLELKEFRDAQQRLKDRETGL